METTETIEQQIIGEMSASIAQISPALALAQSEMTTAKKEANNPFTKKNYADLNSVREACMPALNKNGITVLQPVVYIGGKPFIKTVLLHKSGEFISCLTEIVCAKANDAQSFGSGQTYARRYGLQALCCIGSEDDDGNAASGKKGEEKIPMTPEKSAAFIKYYKAWNEADILDAKEKENFSRSSKGVFFDDWTDEELNTAYEKLIAKIAYKKSLAKK